MALAQIPDGSWVTADGRWHWVDGQWTPLAPAGDGHPGLAWFTSVPRWWVTLLLVGLIGIIPIAGNMNLYGYSMVTARNLRAGYRILPPANFSYLGRGAPVTVLFLVWSIVTFVIAVVVGVAAGAATYGHAHDWAWTVAIGVGVFTTAVSLLSIANLPLLIPALELADREGWGVFHLERLIGHAVSHWRSTWFGLAVFLLWYLVYVGIAVVVSFVPLGGLLAAVAATPVMAAMIAVPLARFDDPPRVLGKGLAALLAVGWVALWLIGNTFVWGVAVVAASVISSHPSEVSCFFDSTCNYAYSGNLETITRVTHDPQDAALVRVDVAFINHSSSSVAINPADYSGRTTTGDVLVLSPECSVPEPASVAPGSRVEQLVCFRLPSPDSFFEVRVPWTGWDSRTDRGPAASPSP